MDVTNKLFINKIPKIAFTQFKQNDVADSVPTAVETQQEVAKPAPTGMSLTELINRASLSMQQTKKAENPEPLNTFTTISAQHLLVKEEQDAIKFKQELDACKTPEEKSAKFAELAEKHSQCPSGKEGGNLGEFGKGQMVSEFENAAANLEIGEISDPVKTQFGWHLIKVNERK